MKSAWHRGKTRSVTAVGIQPCGEESTQRVRTEPGCRAGGGFGCHSP